MSALWNKVQRARSAGGAPEVARRAVARARTSLGKKYRSPLAELRGIDLQVHSHAEDAVNGLAILNGWAPPSGDQLSAWRTDVEESLRSIGREDIARFGPEFDLGPEGATLLYFLIRWRLPRRVVETGVARGVSTRVMLNALDRAGSGSLTSFDVDGDAGGLVIEPPPNWSFRILDEGKSLSELNEHLKQGEAISMFVHDSDHRTEHQRAEFSIAIRALEPGGLLCSDDVDAGPAFFELLRQLELPGIVLMDDRKAVGVTALAS